MQGMSPIRLAVLLLVLAAPALTREPGIVPGPEVLSPQRFTEPQPLDSGQRLRARSYQILVEERLQDLELQQQQGLLDAQGLRRLERTRAEAQRLRLLETR